MEIARYLNEIRLDEEVLLLCEAVDGKYWAVDSQLYFSSRK